MCRSETAHFLKRVTSSSAYRYQISARLRQAFVIPNAWTRDNAYMYDNALVAANGSVIEFILESVDDIEVACDLLEILHNSGQDWRRWIRKWQVRYRFLACCLQLEVPIYLDVFGKPHQPHLAMIAYWPTPWADQYRTEARGLLDTTLKIVDPNTFLWGTLFCAFITFVVAFLLGGLLWDISHPCPEPVPCPEVTPCPEPTCPTVAKFVFPDSLYSPDGMKLVFCFVLVLILVEIMTQLIKFMVKVFERFERIWNLVEDRVADEQVAQQRVADQPGADA